ncbi:MAG: S9 family peptidase [Hyphomonadaceae bacterium]|nr:MAG: dipeptidyl anminopeptidase [Caulobacteraceae bacterium]MBT9445411.1 S9 family peptidase [Hyphomonadaceae bacterium]TPW07079.1 MAG: dipeptidyl anminopeptidase [Alphaproteobacteria bacterium]
MRRAAGIALAIVLGCLMASCGREKARAPVPPVAQAPLIPRVALFGNPERAQARISPKGDFISFLAPLGGYLNVFVMPVDGELSAARAVTGDVARGIRKHFWAEDGAHILYLQDSAGDENWRLHSVDVATGEDRDLTPFPGVQATVVGTSRAEPDWVLVGLNDRDPKWHDLYKINLKTGQRALVQRNTEKFSSFIADRDNIVRLALRNMPDGSVEVHAFMLQGGWKKMFDIPFEDSLTTYPISFTGDGAHFLMFDSMGRDKAALVSVDAMTGDKTVIGENRRADVSDVWIDPVSFEAEAYASEYLTNEWTGVDDIARADIAFLDEKLKGEPTVVSRSADDARWIVVEDGPTTPVRVYRYDRTGERALKPLFDQRPALADAPLQPMIPVEISSSDGQTLVSYLTLPPGSDVNGDGAPERPVPLVINVHGGPWYRDSFGFNPEHQWFANRNYAVLSVNFRGSTGFGKAFINLGNKEWGGAMQRDLTDAMNWAIQRGITTADKVAIYGASFGGYATLVGLTSTPEQYACGVDVVGPSSLKTLFESIPPYWESSRNEFYLRVGDPTKPDGLALLQDRSPLTRASAIRRPLLIVQGANDPRVKQAEAEQIVSAMRARQAPVSYVLYPDEGHGFARPQNRISFYAIAEGFLQQCLGGRVEPIGRDFDGSSLEVKQGADRIPGLAEAVAAIPRSPPQLAPAVKK